MRTAFLSRLSIMPGTPGLAPPGFEKAGIAPGVAPGFGPPSATRRGLGFFAAAAAVPAAGGGAARALRPLAKAWKRVGVRVRARARVRVWVWFRVRVRVRVRVKG